jgi:hypothetical protein
VLPDGRLELHAEQATGTINCFDREAVHLLA